jgi:hypothetical protein
MRCCKPIGVEPSRTRPSSAAVIACGVLAAWSGPGLSQGISCENEAVVGRIELEVKDVSSSQPWSMSIEGNRLYTRGARVEGSGLATFAYELDAEGPPSALGSWPDDAGLRGAAYEGTLVYELIVSAGVASFRVREASDVGGTSIISTLPLPAAVGPSPTLHFGGGDVAFVATQGADKFWGIDLSDPNAPVLGAMLSLPVPPASGSFQYVADRPAPDVLPVVIYTRVPPGNAPKEIRLLDFSSPASPRVAGTIPFTGWAYVQQAADPRVPVYCDGDTLVGGLAYGGAFAVPDFFDRLHQYDISNPDAPTAAPVVSGWDIAGYTRVAAADRWLVAQHISGPVDLYEIGLPGGTERRAIIASVVATGRWAASAVFLAFETATSGDTIGVLNLPALAASGGSGAAPVLPTNSCLSFAAPVDTSYLVSDQRLVVLVGRSSVKCATVFSAADGSPINPGIFGGLSFPSPDQPCGVWGLAVTSSYLYIAKDNVLTTTILNPDNTISFVSNAYLISGTLIPGRSVGVVGEHLYVAGGSSVLKRFSLADPVAPAFAGDLSVPDVANIRAVRGGREALYAMVDAPDGSVHLRVYEVDEVTGALTEVVSIFPIIDWTFDPASPLPDADAFYTRHAVHGRLTMWSYSAADGLQVVGRVETRTPGWSSNRSLAAYGGRAAWSEDLGVPNGGVAQRRARRYESGVADFLGPAGPVELGRSSLGAVLGVGEHALSQATSVYDGGSVCYESAIVTLPFGACAGPSCPADLTGDGQIDSGDLSLFITLYLTASPGADLTGDGHVDSGDLAAFIQLFLAGC